MIIQIAVGIFLGVVFLVAFAVIVYLTALLLTKHRDLMESNDYDIKEWFKTGRKEEGDDY